MESNRPLPKGTADLTPEEFFKYVIKLVNQEMAECKSLVATDFRKKNPDDIRKTINDEIDSLLNGILKDQKLDSLDKIIAKLISMRNFIMSHLSEHDSNRKLIELIAWRIDKLIDKCKNIAFYNHYGINIEPSTFKVAPATDFDFSKGLPDHVLTAMQADPQLCLVYVTGAEAEIAGRKYQVNPYGHALIFLGVAGFIHIDGTNNPPQHMTIPQFNQYLNDNKKSVLGMQTIDLLSINDTLVAIHNAIKANFLWGAVLHNCIDFCFEMFKQGGFNSRRVEYEKLFWSLPTNYLAQTPENELAPGRRLYLNHRPSFDAENMKKAFDPMLVSYNPKARGNILDVDYVVKNYIPEDMIKYVQFIYANLETIITNLIMLRTNQHAEVDKVKSSKEEKMTAGDKTKSATKENRFLLAVNEVKAALNKMGAMIEGTYKPLFDPRRYSIMLQLLDKQTIDLKLNMVAASIAQPEKPKPTPLTLANVRARLSVFTTSSAPPSTSSLLQHDDTKDEDEKRKTQSAAPPEKKSP